MCLRSRRRMCRLPVIDNYSTTGTPCARSRSAVFMHAGERQLSPVRTRAIDQEQMFSYGWVRSITEQAGPGSGNWAFAETAEQSPYLSVNIRFSAFVRGRPPAYASASISLIVCARERPSKARDLPKCDANTIPPFLRAVRAEVAFCDGRERRSVHPYSTERATEQGARSAEMRRKKTLKGVFRCKKWKKTVF